MSERVREREKNSSRETRDQGLRDDLRLPDPHVPDEVEERYDGQRRRQ